MPQAQWKMSSPLGALYLVAGEKGLRGIFYDKQSIPIVRSLSGSAKEIKILSRAARELAEYFSGKRKKFSLPLDIAKGTPFQRRVWTELSKIPYGKTSSYRDVAGRIKSAKATRAVGSANGKNPICIIVPCHRVIAADGTIGGYSGGLGRKVKLLKLEGAASRIVRK